MASSVRHVARLAAAAGGLAAAGYASYAAIAWCEYGNAPPPTPDEQDPLLDRFMPTYDIVERHHIRVAAPASVTLAVAREMDLQSSPIVRTIIRAREILLGATPDNRVRPHALLAEVHALGWGVLADVPHREVVVGAITKPWEANVTFRAVPPDRFAASNEPGHVKIVWTLRADAIGPTESIFRTETRAVATDENARSKFRKYWALLSPGIIVIRWALLGPVKKEAERRARGEYAAEIAAPRSPF